MLMVLLSSLTSIAQVPQAIRYQAIARDINGGIIANKDLAIKIFIHDGYEDGKILYAEKHNGKSNAFGLLNLSIGRGAVVEGIFENINWGLGEKFLSIEIDFGGGYIKLGSSQLLSVPYALYSPSVKGDTGATGLTGATGATGLQGVTGLTGLQGIQGATGLIGPEGPQGEIGLQGIQGLQGTPGTNGTNGLQGATGLTGNAGLQGIQGLQGTAGTNGTNGLQGATGLTGDTGLQGIQGLQGTAGTNGTNGTNGINAVSAFADFYALMPSDNAATIAPGTAISFPQNGEAFGIVRNNNSSFILPTAGYYLITWQVSITEPCQLVLSLNSGAGFVEIANSVVGRATGTSQVSGSRIVRTLSTNNIIALHNPTTASTALTITPIAGGSSNVSASFIITQIK